jgi:hypothetical protein
MSVLSKLGFEKREHRREPLLDDADLTATGSALGAIVLIVVLYALVCLAFLLEGYPLQP